MAREIGLSQLTVFEVTQNSQAQATWGAAERVPWVVNVSATDTIAEYSAYADNIAEISSSKATGATLTIEVSSDMSPELEAKLTGKKYNKASMVSTADDVKKQYAIAYETVMSDGTVRRYCYYNCSISKNEQENETVSDSVTAQTYTLVANATPLVSSKELKIVMDEKEVNKYVQDQSPEHAQVQNAWQQFFIQVPRQVA